MSTLAKPHLESRLFAALKSPSARRSLALPLTILGIWVLLSQLRLVHPQLLVGPERVLARAVQEFREGELLTQLGVSLARDLGGFALGSLLGLLVGALLGLSTALDRLLGASFHAAKQVALFAWIPLMSVWLGTGELAKVAFVALSAFYPVVLHTYVGIRGTAREHLEVARALRFSRLQIFRKVVWPSALPSIFAGLHIGLIYAWLGTIGAEYLLAPGYGVGNVLISGRESFAMDKVLLGVALVGTVGTALNAAATRLEAHLLRWRTPAFETRRERS